MPLEADNGQHSSNWLRRKTKTGENKRDEARGRDTFASKAGERVQEGEKRTMINEEGRERGREGESEAHYYAYNAPRAGAQKE